MDSENYQDLLNENPAETGLSACSGEHSTKWEEPDLVDSRPTDSFGTTEAKKNFLIIAIYQVVMRTGWIFKTESIIMPAVMDAMGGPAWLRGCLPMLNRFGQSVPPLLSSSFVAKSPIKKWILGFCSLVMGLMFIAMALFWYSTSGKGSWWLPAIFLLIYAIFFASTGVNQLSVSTLIGKLVPVKRRGFLMLTATSIGSLSAITCAWVLLRYWLRPESANFTAIFLFAGLAFVVAAGISTQLCETPDDVKGKRVSFAEILKSVLTTLKTHRNFRQLAFVSAMFGMSMTLFPHYQALGRLRLGLQLDSLITFVIAQNIGMAAFSIPAGKMADRYGNRLVLQIVMLAICAGPVVALLLSRAGETGQILFFLVFVIIGLTPVTMRVFANYSLELAAEPEQPKFLGVLSLCMAGPAIVTSALLGLLIDHVGFEPVFLIVIVCLLIGWCCTFFLIEPRHQKPHRQDPA